MGIGIDVTKDLRKWIKNYLGINRDFIARIGKTIDELGQALSHADKEFFRSLTEALSTIGSAREFFADPKTKEKLMETLDSINAVVGDRELIAYLKDTLQTLNSAVGLVDGDLIKGLTNALNTVGKVGELIDTITPYMTSPLITYFGIGSIVLAKVLFLFAKRQQSNIHREQLRTLQQQLMLDLDTGRFIRGSYLQQRHNARLANTLDNNPLQAQLERDAQRYLRTINGMDAATLRNQFKHIEQQLINHLNTQPSSLSPAEIFDSVSDFSHLSVIIEDIYDNTLTSSSIPCHNMSFKKFCTSYDEQNKLPGIRESLSKKLTTCLEPLFSELNEQCIDVRTALCELLTAIFCNQNIEVLHDRYPNLTNVITACLNSYNRELSKESIKLALRKANYNDLTVGTVRHDMLVDLLKKRVILATAHNLFCKLKFPKNLPREMWAGTKDVYKMAKNTMALNSSNTFYCMALGLWGLVTNTKASVKQIGHFWWHRPIRALTSAVITTGATAAAGKLVTNTPPPPPPGGPTHSVALIRGPLAGKTLYATPHLTSETYATIHSFTSEAITTQSTLVSSTGLGLFGSTGTTVATNTALHSSGAFIYVTMGKVTDSAFADASILIFKMANDEARTKGLNGVLKAAHIDEEEKECKIVTRLRSFN